MKKKMLVKAMSFLMAICMVFGGISAISAYAMELDESNNEVIEVASTTTRPIKSSIIVDELPWGKDIDALDGGFVVHNYTDITVTASTFESTHRMCFCPSFRVYSKDPNQSAVKLTVTIYRNGHVSPSDPVYEFYNYSNGVWGSLQSEWFDVRPGEVITLRVDASTYNPSESTGSYRYAEISEFGLYCD